jgi:vacuolar protein sorting-associated protein 26
VYIIIKHTGDSIEGVLHVSPGKFLSRERPTTRRRTHKQSRIYVSLLLNTNLLSLSLSLFAKMTTTHTFIYNLLFLFYFSRLVFFSLSLSRARFEVPGKRVEHLGVKIELIGRVEAYFDRSGREGDGDFLSILREIEPPGTLSEPISKPFSFKSVDFPNESYNGKNASLRVFLKVTVVRNYASNIVNEYKLWVRNVREQPEVNNSIKMEVGIEDCLHIEFEYSRAKYHLRDAIIGKIFFLLVRVKIKRMEIEIRRREICGLGANAHGENEVIAKFEVMEGAPVRGECIPVRLFLSPYDLTPTYKSVNNKFSVKYYLNLVLIDDEDRRYFKQQEIILYRSELL